MTEMNYGDYLIVDPGYIKKVTDGIDLRFDALKCVKTLWEGDDGVYRVCNEKGLLKELGVDSGRIWILQAEFDCEVEIDCGLSDYILVSDADISKIYIENWEEDDYGDA